MKSNPAIRVTAACLLAAACWAFSSVDAMAGAWGFTGGAGVAGPYRLISNKYYDQSFGPTGSAVAAAMRRISSDLDLRMATGWSGYGQDVPLTQVPENPPTRLHQAAGIVPLSMGLRWHLPARGFSNDRPVFIDVAPALVWSRWRERFTQIGYDLNGTSQHIDAVDTRSTLRPGIDVGLGVGFRSTEHVHPEFGVRFLASTSPGDAPIPSLYGAKTQGLRQWSAGMNLSWEP